MKLLTALVYTERRVIEPRLILPSATSLYGSRTVLVYMECRRGGKCTESRNAPK